MLVPESACEPGWRQAAMWWPVAMMKAPRRSLRSDIVNSSDGGERLFQVGEQVVDVLDAERQPDRLLADARLVELGRRELPMRRRRRMRRQRLGVTDVDQPREELQRVEEARTGLAPLPCRRLDAE